MRIFRILLASGEPEFVREDDLEAVLCGECHGALRKESHQESDYSRRESFLLRCQKCGGSYGATLLTDEEARQLFAAFTTAPMKWLDLPYHCEQLGFHSPQAIFDILCEHSRKDCAQNAMEQSKHDIKL